jgi:hypothetical protein
MAANGGQRRLFRRTVALTLVVLAILVAFLSVFAIWVNRQVLNTDNWTKTSSQLLQQAVIRDRIAERLTDQLFASVDVDEALRDVLPPRAEVLAGPAANALRTQVEKRARIALARPAVQALWADANREAHRQLLTVIEGGGRTVSTESGRVVLNVDPILASLQEQVGIGGRLRKVLPASATQIQVFQSTELGTAQDAVRVIRPLPVILLLISLGLVAIAMLIAPDWRRRAVRAYGFGFILVGLVTLAFRSIAGDEFVSSLASTAAAEPAVEQVWTIATDLLNDIAVAAIVYGAVMVVGAWLAGPTTWARAVRASIAPYLREPAIAYSALAVAVIALVWWAPTPAWRNVAMVLILVGLLALGVEALRRQVIREFPEATRAEAMQRHRERWASVVAASRRRGGALRDSASRTAQSASERVAASRAAATARFSAAQDTRLDQLERLVKLREAGILDEEELRAEKARILNADSDQLATT